MYKHWRYRPANPDRPYPFYANFYRPLKTCFSAIGRGTVKWLKKLKRYNPETVKAFHNRFKASTL